MYVTEDDDRDEPSTAEVDVIDIEYVARDASMAGIVRIDMRRAAGATRFLAAVLRRDEDPVVVIDYGLPMARSAFEFRSSGVWVELCCEEPLEHWTVGLEAFGLALPAEGICTPDSFGDRVPVGLDLDVETARAAEGDSADFAIEVKVLGEVLVADAAYEIDAVGIRRRRTDGGRAGSDLIANRPELIGELTVEWPLDDGRPLRERRGWFGGSLPGWTVLPVADD